MAAVLKAVGTVAGVVASVAKFIPGAGQVVAAVASVVAVAASLGAAIIGTKPPVVQGSTTDVLIGANMPSSEICGRAYHPGNRVTQSGYGGTVDGVDNPYLLIVDVYGVGGPYHALVTQFTDFTPVTFSGGNATGYFHNYLYCDTQLGATPEASALAPNWSGASDWGAGYKLSGKAAILWNARWPRDGKIYASGFPQTGALWEGAFCYDPRLDSTYPGGSGSHRWADPKDKAAFSAAKATWTWSRNPGLRALRYALGTWERDESDSDAEYVKVFGIGGSIDQVEVADFVEHANVCDANGWNADGVIFESGADGEKWANLKRIAMAGGAEPVFKGARLGLRINAPRISLDTITLDDIAEGEPIVPGTRPYSERKNTLVPYYISEDHKFESVPSSPVQVTEYVTLDGEEKREDWAFDLVQGGSGAADQAAQLTGYELVNRREQGPIVLPLKPRLRSYPAGVQLSVSAEVQALYGIQQPDLIVASKTTDIAAMSWQFAFVTETAAKHPFALGLTGTSPPAPTIVPPEEIDGSVPSGSGALRVLSQSDPYPITSDDTHIYIAAYDVVLQNGVSISLPSATIGSLTSGTSYGVFWNIAGVAYETEVSPAATHMASDAYALLGAIATSSSGSYPPSPPSPPGWGGGGGTYLP